MAGEVWVIDATNWAHVFWHAAGARGVRLLPMLRDRIAGIRAQFKPAEVFTAWDTPGPSKRRDLFPGYKANRGDKPAELVEQLAACEHGLGDLAAPLGADGFEADDIAATAAAVVTGRGGRCVIASPDKDLRQCLAENAVTICRDIRRGPKGALSAEWLTEGKLRESGLAPSQWADYQCLVGDTADAIPGCPGIGDKTARDLLGKAGTLDAIARDPWRWISSDVRRGRFVQWVNAGGLFLARELVTLCRDVPGIAAAM